MSTEDERVARYLASMAQAVHEAPDDTTKGRLKVLAAYGAMAVANAEQEALRAEVARSRADREWWERQRDQWILTTEEQVVALAREEDRAEAAERDLAVERARVARVKAALNDFRNHADWCAAVSHAGCCLGECDCHVSTLRAVLADPDAQNGSGRPVTPAPSTDTSEGSQGRTEAHSTPNEANRGRRTKETT